MNGDLMNGTMIVIEESTMINNEGKYYVSMETCITIVHT